MGLQTPTIFRVLILLGIAFSTNAYSKYGRSCKDIGCLPSEVCTMAYESCSYTQREGKDCGGYPTCKRNTDSSGIGPGASLNPAPENTRVNQPAFPSSNREHNNPNYNPAPPIDPNSVFGQPVHNQQPNWNQYPIFPIPTQRNAQQPMYPQIPQPYPPQQNPYGQPPYQPQVPFAFGNPPPPRNYPYYTTTKEPNTSLSHSSDHNAHEQEPATSRPLPPAHGGGVSNIGSHHNPSYPNLPVNPNYPSYSGGGSGGYGGYNNINSGGYVPPGGNNPYGGGGTASGGSNKPITSGGGGGGSSSSSSSSSGGGSSPLSGLFNIFSSGGGGSSTGGLSSILNQFGGGGSSSSSSGSSGLSGLLNSFGGSGGSSSSSSGSSGLSGLLNSFGGSAGSSSGSSGLSGLLNSFGGGGSSTGSHGTASGSSGSSSGSLLSGLGSILSGGGGNLGTLLNTRNLIENRRVGGLFNEAPSAASESSSNSAARPKVTGYPTQPSYQPSGGYQKRNVAENNMEIATTRTVQYGWNV